MSDCIDTLTLSSQPVRTPCGHLFHRVCISRLLRFDSEDYIHERSSSVCPMCRAELPSTIEGLTKVTSGLPEGEAEEPGEVDADYRFDEGAGNGERVLVQAGRPEVMLISVEEMASALEDLVQLPVFDGHNFFDTPDRSSPAQSIPEEDMASALEVLEHTPIFEQQVLFVEEPDDSEEDSVARDVAEEIAQYFADVYVEELVEYLLIFDLLKRMMK